MRGATYDAWLIGQKVKFQLTRPMRGATSWAKTARVISPISTHTPHAGRDRAAVSKMETVDTISTHTPHAGRDDFIRLS